MRTLLGLVIAIPVLATAGISATVVDDRWDDRRAAVGLAEAAEAFDRAVRLRAAVTAEEVHSSVLGLAPALGTDLAAVANLEVTRMELGSSRRVVEDAVRRAPSILDDADLRVLARVRRLVDSGTADWAAVDQGFRRVDAALADEWDRRLAAIEVDADARALSAELRARLRAVREAAAAFDSGAALMRAVVGLASTPEITVDARLRQLRADGEFWAAVDRLLPDLGPGAAAAWRRVEVDPAAQRTEDFLSTLRERAVGATDAEAPVDDVLSLVSDGQRWSVLLIDVTSAASDDLRTVALDDSSEAGRATVRWAAATAALAVVSLVLVSLLARVLARPTVMLGRAARRVAEGDFDLPAVPVKGPREVADTARAFNEMSATLAAVEDHAVALAEDPESPVLDEQLPGRTGLAMQRALDALRASIELAEEQRARLALLASTDDLTGLLNRKGTLDAVGRVMARDQRDGRRTVALFVDVDGLKQLNDTHGHASGDAAIRAMARALAGSTRRSDVVGRIGGDEFLVVGPEPTGGRPAIEALAQRVLDAVRQARFVVADGSDVELRCSVGIAVSGEGADTGDALVQAADAGLYAAKRAGRDRWGWSVQP